MSDTPPPPPPYLPPPPGAGSGSTFPAIPPVPTAPAPSGGGTAFPSAPPFGGGPGPYGAGVPMGPPSRSGKATAGFILGLASIVLFFSVAVPVLALIFGLLGAKEIKASAGQKKGMTFARIGWIFGLLGLIGGIALWVAVAVNVAGTTSVFDLKTGECVERPDDSADEVSRLKTYDCDEPHGAEVFATGDLGSGDEPYPGVAEVNDMISRECLPAFEEYVGVALGDQTELNAFPIYPTEDTWDNDQGYVCLATLDSGGDLTATIKGSGR